MITKDILDTITTWSHWAAKEDNKRYDVALFKIWIQFEKFLSELFVTYAIGGASEKGYIPEKLIVFKDESHLNAFLKTENRTYIDYLSKIENLSKHIFKKNPFDVVFLDSNNKKAYSDVILIRNYVAHESGDAKNKILRNIFGNNPSRFLEPNEYLQTNENTTKTTYYTYYVNAIKNMTLALVEKIE